MHSLSFSAVAFVCAYIAFNGPKGSTDPGVRAISGGFAVLALSFLSAAAVAALFGA
jgi:hypothetical protein